MARSTCRLGVKVALLVLLVVSGSSVGEVTVAELVMGVPRGAESTVANRKRSGALWPGARVTPRVQVMSWPTSAHAQPGELLRSYPA